MAVIRRHKYQVVLTLIIFVLLVAVFWLPPQGAPEATASDEPAVRKIDLETYSDVNSLRGELCLTDRDLAAMGCTQERAESILGALVEWYERNRIALEECERQNGEAQRALRMAIREVNVGPRNETALREIPLLIRASVDAETRRRELLETAADAVDSRMMSEEGTIWATARKNRHLPLRYRYLPGLDERQGTLLAEAFAQSGIDSNSATERFEQLELTGSQRLAIAQTSERLSQHMSGVRKAVNAILPMPEELVVAEGEIEEAAVDP